MPNAVVPPIFRSEMQLRLLGLLLLGPQREWTARDLTERLGATAISVHRELHRILSAGLVERNAVGRTYVYRAVPTSPLSEPLRLLLERTIGVEAELRRVLADEAGVEAAFIHGSFANGTKVAPVSDVDVVVLGNVDARALRRRVRDVERRVGREIDLLAYRPEELAALAKNGNSLAKSITRGPLTPLVGSREILQRS